MINADRLGMFSNGRIGQMAAYITTLWVENLRFKVIDIIFKLLNCVGFWNVNIINQYCIQENKKHVQLTWSTADLYTVCFPD